MNNPCNECIVASMCSNICNNAGQFIYDHEKLDSSLERVIRRYHEPFWSTYIRAVDQKTFKHKVFRIGINDDNSIKIRKVNQSM